MLLKTCRKSTFGFNVSYILMRWWRGSLWRRIGEKYFCLFTFVLDSHHWNENADDTEPLSSAESHFLCHHSWEQPFSALQEPVLFSQRWPCLQPLVLTFFFICWLEEWDCFAAGCIKGGRACALSALKSSAWGHLGQAHHIIPDTFFLSLLLRTISYSRWMLG